MPVDPEKVLDEAITGAKEHWHPGPMNCETECPIDRLVQVARLVGRIQQATLSKGLVSGCQCVDCDGAFYEALRKERDRLLAELESLG